MAGGRPRAGPVRGPVVAAHLGLPHPGELAPHPGRARGALPCRGPRRRRRRGPGPTVDPGRFRGPEDRVARPLDAGGPRRRWEPPPEERRSPARSGDVTPRRRSTALPGAAAHASSRCATCTGCPRTRPARRWPSARRTSGSCCTGGGPGCGLPSRTAEGCREGRARRPPPAGDSTNPVVLPRRTPCSTTGSGGVSERRWAPARGARWTRGARPGSGRRRPSSARRTAARRPAPGRTGRGRSP